MGPSGPETPVVLQASSEPEAPASTGRVEDQETPSDSQSFMDYETFYRDLRKPDFIPGYEIIRKIGAGVFGDVFKVRKKSIGRIYVIKFLKTENEAQRAIIRKELASLKQFAQIDHPNLVGIEDQGAVGETPYIIMTFAGDQTLQDRLQQGPLPRSELGNVFDQIVAGVAALHERAIVHFDLKPANIFIRENTVRVGDYGLAKMLSESRQSLSFGRGTPYYMAPEVMRRKGDFRADVYSLGTILFELITGRVPFEGDSDWEVLKKHEIQPVPFPEAFPPGLRSVVETAMRKKPEERFVSAGALRNAFRGVAVREIEGMSDAVRMERVSESHGPLMEAGSGGIALTASPGTGERFETTGRAGHTGPVRGGTPRIAGAAENAVRVGKRPSHRKHWGRVFLLMGLLGMVGIGFMAFVVLPMLLVQPDHTPSVKPVSSSAPSDAGLRSDGPDVVEASIDRAPPRTPAPGRSRPLDVERFRRSLEDVLFVVNLINTQGQVLEAARSLANDEEASQFLSKLLEKLDEQSKIQAPSTATGR